LRIGRYAKAIVAFFAPTLTDIAVALAEEDLVPSRVGIAAAKGFITSVIVWAVPNEEG
jgi:hypothetical protein